MAQIRVYPTACQSATCGKLSCPADCPRLPALLEFKAWRARAAAVKTDPIWCPTVWTATKDETKEEV